MIGRAQAPRTVRQLLPSSRSTQHVSATPHGTSHVLPGTSAANRSSTATARGTSHAPTGASHVPRPASPTRRSSSKAPNRASGPSNAVSLAPPVRSEQPIRTWLVPSLVVDVPPAVRLTPRAWSEPPIGAWLVPSLVIDVPPAVVLTPRDWSEPTIGAWLVPRLAIDVPPAVVLTPRAWSEQPIGAWLVPSLVVDVSLLLPGPSAGTIELRRRVALESARASLVRRPCSDPPGGTPPVPWVLGTPPAASGHVPLDRSDARDVGSLLRADPPPARTEGCPTRVDRSETARACLDPHDGGVDVRGGGREPRGECNPPRPRTADPRAVRGTLDRRRAPRHG